MLLEFLSERQFVSEEMDNLDLAGSTLTSTLTGLSRINKFLGNSNAVLRHLKPIIRQSKTPLKIIDLGCGGGDLLLSIAEFCETQNISIQLIGMDGNPNIVKYCIDRSQQFPMLQFQVADILDSNFQLPQCDLLISSHFMYHFTDAQLIHFLKHSKEKVSTKIIFSDLQRSVISYRLFQLIGLVFRFPPMIRKDGLKAITRSFRRRELERIIKGAGITHYSVKWKWAFRYLVEIG